MKNIKLTTILVIAMGSFVYGGGDFAIVTPYETQDSAFAEDTYVETPVKEVYIAPLVPKNIEIVETAVVELPVEKKYISANGFYAGLGIVVARYNTNCKTGCRGAGTDKTVGIIARAGYDFNKYIGLEARGIRTSISNDGGTIKHAGIFVKPMLPVGETVNVYGLVGIAKTTTQGVLQRTDAESLALGAGVELDLSEDSAKNGRYNREFDGAGDQEKGVGLFIDYERMVAKSGAPDLDALSAGVTYDF
jgi:hypothetical protein